MFYHKDVYLPDSIRAFIPKGSFQLIYTKHADLARISDEFGLVPKLSKIDFNQATLIEVEIVNSKLHRFLVRLNFSSKRYITYVLVPFGRDFKVVTLWLTIKRLEDKRVLRNKSKYCSNPLTNTLSAV